MKRFIPVILLMLFVAPFISGQNQNKQFGKWKFEAPNAPEGYTAGIIEVASAEKGPTVLVSLGESDYKLPADKVTIKDGVLSFSVNVEGNEVSIVLTPESDKVMKGNATYSEGSIPLTLTKYKPEKEE